MDYKGCSVLIQYFMKNITFL